MTGVNGWIWATLVGLSVLVPVVAAVAAFRAAPAAGIDPGRTALAVGSSLGIWWLLVVGAGGAELFRADSDAVFPVIALAVGLPIIAGLVVLPRLSGFKRLTASIPQAWLLAAQAPRILGITFLVLFSQGKLPAHFALTAGIGDLAVGLAAPAVAYWYATGRAGRHGLAIAFNVVGVLDLVLAVGTGFLSAPSPLQVFSTNPSTEAMTVLPMVLVPAFLLPALLTVHAISIRRLIAARRSVAAGGTRFARRAFS
jgi:hypothetical protein